MPSGVYPRNGYHPRKSKPRRDHICGVYSILNTVTGEMYVGSSNDITSRIDFHHRRIFRGFHENKKINKAILEYGYEAFGFLLLEEATPKTRYKRETYWLQELQPEYNTELEAALNGKGIGGYQLTEEHKLLISKSHETRTFYPSHPKSEDEKRRIGEKSKGNQYALGAQRSEEEKIIMAHKRAEEWARFSPEERTARANKSWETRRANIAKKLESDALPI